ncbi:MAG TPA: glycine/sarcosine/betaine reductase selenoprotein B family protein [Thermoanaerobaculia bacterium]|nr:glycine/sarcosine/betaine reductase selenoprotein B family protein [Thermoanaerobaculia bacterium]
MGRIDEFSLVTQLFLRAYRWRRIDPVPWQPLRRPLAECRVALLSSAGLVAPGMEPFDERVRGGDWSYRELPADVELASLVDSHRSGSFDHSGISRDPNLALPLDRLRELAGAGRIGEVNRRHFSFMGSLTAVGRFVRESAPAMARALAGDGVDLALLVPV